jgi:uncharacterized membrane protein YraQ (UPF0718 family)
MLIPTIIMAVIAIVLLVIAYSRGDGTHILALKSGASILLEVLPLLIFAFIIAGTIQHLLSPELISRWVGAESGLRGVVMGTLAGGFMPGGPVTSLPVAAAIYKSGAGIGTMVAFLTSWSLWAFARLPLEIGIMGFKFTAIRLACTFFMPFIAGLLAHWFFSNVKVM